MKVTVALNMRRLQWAIFEIQERCAKHAVDQRGEELGPPLGPKCIGKTYGPY